MEDMIHANNEQEIHNNNEDLENDNDVQEQLLGTELEKSIGSN